MLLKWFSTDSTCNSALELFVHEIQSFLQERLLSVMLYGSIVFNDLAPGYGDLDFVAFLSGSLSDVEAQKLIEIRKTFRSGEYGIIAHMLEGSFLPVHMAKPRTKGEAVWWGTSGERIWNENELEALDVKVIKDRGIVIYGDDLRHFIPEVSDTEYVVAIRKFRDTMRNQWKPGTLHSIDWILTCARHIYWLREGLLSSKSEAADWGFLNLNGEWRNELPRAKQLRLHPELYETANTKRWLDGLETAVKEAVSELSDEISLFEQMAK